MPARQAIGYCVFVPTSPQAQPKRKQYHRRYSQSFHDSLYKSREERRHIGHRVNTAFVFARPDFVKLAGLINNAILRSGESLAFAYHPTQLALFPARYSHALVHETPTHDSQESKDNSHDKTDEYRVTTGPRRGVWPDLAHRGFPQAQKNLSASRMPSHHSQHCRQNRVAWFAKPHDSIQSQAPSIVKRAGTVTGIRRSFINPSIIGSFRETPALL